jgi:diadenylate cyclase
VARSIDVPVVAVSEDLAVITIYRGDAKHPLDPVARLLSRANQALQTLERYRERLRAVTTSLTALEVEDLVTVRDVVTVLQRAEMVRRIAEEVESYNIELGTDGRLVRLQLEEMLAGVSDDRRDVIRDYLVNSTSEEADQALARLGSLSTERILDLGAVATLLHFPPGTGLDAGVEPRGYRLLSKIPRLQARVINGIVERYGSLQKVMRATAEDLDEVEGVGEASARAVKEGVARLAESSILDRYS